MTNEVRRLPLWKYCLEKMRTAGLQYGQRFTTEFFESELSENANSIRFGTDVSKIRKELEHDGFYLSGQGLKGVGFEIIPAADNHLIMKRYLHESRDRTERAVTLGTNTPMESLSEAERLRHQQLLERAQIRRALIGKERPIYAVIQKTAPNLIKAIQSKEPPVTD